MVDDGIAGVGRVVARELDGALSPARLAGPRMTNPNVSDRHVIGPDLKRRRRRHRLEKDAASGRVLARKIDAPRPPHDR